MYFLWFHSLSVKNLFNKCKGKSPRLYFSNNPQKMFFTSGDSYVKLSITEICASPNYTWGIKMILNISLSLFDYINILKIAAI